LLSSLPLADSFPPFPVNRWSQFFLEGILSVPIGSVSCVSAGVLFVKS